MAESQIIILQLGIALLVSQVVFWWYAYFAQNVAFLFGVLIFLSGFVFYLK